MVWKLEFIKMLSLTDSHLKPIVLLQYTSMDTINVAEQSLKYIVFGMACTLDSEQNTLTVWIVTFCILYESNRLTVKLMYTADKTGITSQRWYRSITNSNVRISNHKLTVEVYNRIKMTFSNKKNLKAHNYPLSMLPWLYCVRDCQSSDANYSNELLKKKKKCCFLAFKKVRCEQQLKHQN